MESRGRTGILGICMTLLSGAVPAFSGDATPGELFPEMMKRLVARSALYEKAALGFSCEETVIQGRFSAGTGENKREEKSRYDYLYEGSSDKGYREIRMLPSKTGDPSDSKQVDPDLGVPGAYDWALLFTPQHQPHFRFDPAGTELVGFHSTFIIAFRGGRTFERGKEIAEWNGRVWVDSESGNFVKVEAEPNGQEELLALRTDEWRKALRIVGLPTRRQPHGFHYRLQFNIDKFGLSFPGDAETRRFVLDSASGEEEIKLRIAQRFRNYVFFNVHSEEDFLQTESSGIPPPPASSGK
ncbi:MAG TPA: hypothetical protein VGR38_05910 [Candidatus Polarisedimenticolia bacterium]|nr:hypothetical protein [Candidatus Polarisedimenticolia bacterium]